MKRRDDDLELSDKELNAIYCSVMLTLAYYEKALETEDCDTDFLKTKKERKLYTANAKMYRAVKMRLTDEMERRGLETE